MDNLDFFENKTLDYVKLKNFKESSDIFGFRKIKEKIFKENKKITLDDFRIEEQYQCKKDGLYRNTLLIKFNDKHYRFIQDDVEFFFKKLPKYNKPKDRKFAVGKTVKIVNDHKLKIKKGSFGVIVEITKTHRNSNLVANSANSIREYDIVKIKNNDNIHTVYAKQLKII